MKTPVFDPSPLLSKTQNISDMTSEVRIQRFIPDNMSGGKSKRGPFRDKKNREKVAQCRKN